MKNAGASPAGKGALPVIIAVIMAVVGYAAGYTSGASRIDSARAEGAREALASAKAKLDASGLFPETHLTSLRGTVKAVSGDALDIDVAQTVANPLDAQAPLVRHVTLAKDASVIRMKAKPEAARFKELDEYEKAVKAAQEKGTTPPAAPLSYEEEKIALSDLKAGDTVIVDALTDIARAESFAATSVRAESRPAAAPAPATPTAPTPAPTPSSPTAPPPAAPTPPPTPTAPPAPAPAPAP